MVVVSLTNKSVVIGLGALFSNSVLLGLPITERAFGSDALSANFAIISIHAPVCYLLGVLVMEFSRADGRPIGGSTFQAWCGGRIALKIRQRFFERKQATAMEDVYISKYNPGAEEFFKEVRDYAKRRRVAKKDLPTAFPKLAEEAWEMPTLEDSTEGFEQKARHFLLYLDKRTHSSELNPHREKLHDELKTALEHQMRESASALIVHIYSRTPRPPPRFLLRIY